MVYNTGMADRYIQLTKKRKGWVKLAESNDPNAFVAHPKSVIVKCHHNTSWRKIEEEAEKLWRKK